MVSIVTKLQTGQLRNQGFIYGTGRDSSLSTVSRPAVGSIQPPIQLIPGALSSGLKRPESEADHSPPTSAAVKNAWRCTSTPPYISMACRLMKHNYSSLRYSSLLCMDIFTFHPYLLQSSYLSSYFSLLTLSYIFLVPCVLYILTEWVW